MHRHRPRRLPGFSYVGPHRYFLTACTADRHPAFFDPAVIECVRRCFLQSAVEHDMAILTYCFMPDHLDLLVEGLSGPSDMCRFMKVMKGRSGLQARRRTGRRLWQDGYYDHILRDDETTESVIVYILANPIRAGLVSRIGDYPFVGSSRYTLAELTEMVQMRGGVNY